LQASPRNVPQSLAMKGWKLDLWIALAALVVGGLTGKFFQPLALSYALAVLASMLVALTVTPALALILLHRAVPRRDSPLVHGDAARTAAGLAAWPRSPDPGRERGPARGPAAGP